MKNEKFAKLGKCILMDAIGMMSAAIPVVGGLLDIAWAPIAASVSYKMFGEKKGKYTSLITFIEEILPMTDAFPSFTIFFILFDVFGVGKELDNKEKPHVVEIID